MSTKSLTKVCLFGGTLLAAGLSQNSTAEEFLIGQSTHNHGIDPGPIVSAYAGGGNFILNTVTGVPFGPSSIESAFETGVSASVDLNENGLFGSVEKEVSTFGYFAFMTSFTVDTDMEVEISWDASPDVPWIDRHFRVWQSLGPTLFEYDVNNGPHKGTMTLTLNAGQLYWTDALYRSTGDRGAGSFSISVVQTNCQADLDGDGNLNFIDISNFLSLYSMQDPTADFNTDSAWNFLDVSEFLTEFSAGCP
jgi:hypothetical protein